MKKERERERQRERERRRRRFEEARNEDGSRFHRWPAASSFDPSLIILVSTNLIATHIASSFDRSRFFIPLPKQPIAIFRFLPPIVVSLFLSLSRLIPREPLTE